MSEEEKKWNKRDKPTYIMVPRKMIIAWVSTTATLFILVAASFQYTNFVDRKSNGIWCDFFTTLDNTTAPEPPSAEASARRKAFDRLQNLLGC